jgi:FAD/FMN-containing dehydrogenase
MTSTPSLAQSVTELRGSFSGQLLEPADEGYDEARRVHNGLVDKKPALIARCKGMADIADAVTLARKLGVEVAVRGGGHNVAGRATVENGLMIDLAPMKGIRVDPAARSAWAQGGVLWSEFNRETQVHGLATTGGVVSTTGIAGLTLGGGIGWLMCKHGLALDNLISVDVVTSEGQALKASEKENADLFWALRGGGGNFGVAAALEYRLHPVGPTITGGLVAYPIDKARDVLKFFRDLTSRKMPDELMVVAGLIHAPDGSGAKLAAMAVCHCGAPDDGAAATRPVREFGSPVANTIGPMSYCALNGMLDAAYPRGALNYWKANFLEKLDDAAIDRIVENFSRCSAPMGQMLLEHFHGAATRVPVGDTAFPHRSEGYNLVVIAEWMEPSMSERCIGWAREAYSAMQPHIGRGRGSIRGCLRAQPAAASGDQDDIRSGEFLSHEPEYKAARVTGSCRPCRQGDRPMRERASHACAMCTKLPMAGSVGCAGLAPVRS